MSGFSRWGQMTERKQFRAIKGTRDILPPESARWNWFEHTAREVFESYNFGEIRLPVFEETELFARSIGTETDVVSKEMFSFQDMPYGLKRPEMIGDYGAYLKQLQHLYDTNQIPRNPYNERQLAEFAKEWTWFET